MFFISPFSTTIKNKLFFFFLLALCSFTVHFTVAPYLPTGKQLLANNTFSEGSKDWQIDTKNNWSKISITPNHVTLSSRNIAKHPKIWQKLQTDNLTPTVLLQAKVKNDNIVQGKYDWNMGRVLLLQYVNEKPIYSTNHSLIKLDKTKGWHLYKSAFKIAPQAEYIAARIELNNATGEFHCKDLELYNAIDNPLFITLKKTLFVCWAAFLIFLFAPYLKAISLRKKIIVIILLTVTVFGITMNVNLKNTLKKEINTSLHSSLATIEQQEQLLQAEIPQTASSSLSKTQGSYTFPHPDITKLAHFILFTILGFILCSTKTSSTKIIFLDILLFASVTEILQLFIYGRSSLFQDVLIDFTGGMLGAGVCFFASKVIHNKHQ